MLLHVQLLGTAWDVHECEVWCGAEALRSHLWWSRGQSWHPAGQQGGVHRAGSAMLPERADCLARQLALTHGEQADGSSSFGWKDNISCSWFFLRQVLLMSGGRIQAFQGLDSAPGLCSPRCFKPLSVSVLHGRMCRKASFHHCSSHLPCFTTRLCFVLDCNTVLNISLPLCFRVFSWFFPSLSYQAS